MFKRISNLIKKFKKEDWEVVSKENNFILKSTRQEKILLNLEIDEISSENGFSYSLDGWNPFVQTSLEILNGCKNYKESTLFKFYKVFQPTNIGEFYFIKSNHLEKVKSPGFISPWEYMSPNEYGNWLIRCNRNENSYVSSNSELNGLSICGPVSDKKCELEFNRLQKLVFSIQEKGYKYQEVTPISITPVSWDGKDFYFVRHGRHRVAVLSALGYDKIPVKLQPTGYITEKVILNGPAVLNGYWDTDDIHTYFNGLSDKGREKAKKLGFNI